MKLMNVFLTFVFLLVYFGGSPANAQEDEKPVIDSRQLNSAFKFTASDVDRWIKRGNEAAKRGKADRLFEMSRKQPSWTRGKKGRANANVNLWEWQGMQIAYEAFDASRKYEKMTIPPTIVEMGGYFKVISFAITLVSEPKVDFRGGKLAAALSSLGGNTIAREVVGEANADEVKVVKIVLLDDKGNVLVANDKDSTFEVNEGTTTFRGVDVKRSTETANSNSSAYGSAYGNGGSAYGSAYGSSTTTFRRETLIPYAENHKYYEAHYSVRFPLFDDKGEPVVKEGVKEITLRIVTEAGEMSVVYKLSDFKK